MIIVGLTGGIGSGKSTVAAILKVLGYSVYNSDDRAKVAYEDPAVLQKVVELLGGEVLENHQVVFSRIAALVFDHPALLVQLNAIIHPWVKKDFDRWMKKQKESIVFKESALLFETGIYRSCDQNIWVDATEQTRMRRVMKRNNWSEAQVLSRMKQQISPEKGKALADLVLKNEDDFLVPLLLHWIQGLER